MANHLSQIQTHANLDAQMLMVVATLRSGETRNQVWETATYQVLTPQGWQMNGRPFQGPKNVTKVSYILLLRKFNVVLGININVIEAFLIKLIKIYRGIESYPIKDSLCV